MKKILIALAALTAALVIGCKENIEQPEPEIGFSLGRNIVEMPASGGEATVTWSTDNPIDGMNVELGGDIPEWVNNFDTQEEGRIVFNVDSTNLEMDTREARIQVNYGEDTASFRIIQEGAEAKIDFEFVRATPTAVMLKVAPKDENMNRYVNIIEKSVYDTYGSDEDLFNADIETFNWFAEMSNMTLEQWMTVQFDMMWSLSQYVMFQEVNYPHGKYNLESGTEHVAYTYGINGAGEILSQVYDLETATQALDLTNTMGF